MALPNPSIHLKGSYVICLPNLSIHLKGGHMTCISNLLIRLSNHLLVAYLIYQPTQVGVM